MGKGFAPYGDFCKQDHKLNIFGMIFHPINTYFNNLNISYYVFSLHTCEYLQYH